MNLKAKACEWPGCVRCVTAHDPIGTVICERCAFWMLHGRPTPFFRRLGTMAQDLYFLSPDDDLLMTGAPVTTVRTEDGTDITSHRLRCVGVPPVPTPADYVLIELTPRKALGVS